MKKALFLAAALAALVPTSAVADRPCVKQGWIRNWNAISDRILMVEDTGRRKYRLTLIGTCYDLNRYQKLGFRSRGSLSISCLRPGDEVIQGEFRPGAPRGRCSITRIDYYTPEMEAADRAGRRR